MKRRVFLQGSLAVGAMAVTGLFMPTSAMAAWPKDAFQATELSAALKALWGADATPPASDKIKIDAPDLADDGSMVRVKVMTDLPNAESITIFSPKNPIPLIASFKLGPGAKGFISTKIKMAESAEIVAVVKAGGQLHSAARHVKVTAGGCK